MKCWKSRDDGKTPTQVQVDTWMQMVKEKSGFKPAEIVDVIKDLDEPDSEISTCTYVTKSEKKVLIM